MAYNKRIRGDSNTANEEFSHNRVYIEAGISGVILVLFMIILVSAAILWMMHTQGALFSTLIMLSFVAVFVGAGITGACFVAVRISDMIKEVRVNRLMGNTIISGEVTSHYDGEQWTHLSSIHEQGKIPQLPMKAQSLNTDESTILELHDKGMSLRAIEKQLKDANVTYYQIQKVVAAHRQ